MEILVALILLAIFYRPEKDGRSKDDDAVIFFAEWDPNRTENEHHGFDYQNKPESPYDDSYDDGGPDW